MGADGADVGRSARAQYPGALDRGINLIKGNGSIGLDKFDDFPKDIGVTRR